MNTAARERRGPATLFGVRPARSAGALFLRYWTVLLLVVAWGVWVEAFHVNQIVAPSPGAVFGDLAGHPGVYATALAETMLMAVGGLVLGMTAGVLLAAGVWASKVLSGLMTPLILVVRSVPVVALLPVILSVVGSGTSAMLTVTSLITFFPAFAFTTSGLRSAPAVSADLFTVLHASKLSRLRLLLLPQAVRGLLVALRLTAPGAVLVAMLAEYLMGSGGGLGQLFFDSVSFSEVVRAWGTSVVATAVSVVTFVAARAVERWGTERLT